MVNYATNFSVPEDGGFIPDPDAILPREQVRVPDNVIQDQIRRLQSMFSEYYSGTQVNVYLNDVKLEMVGIGWNAAQTKTPIFGYASQNYDAVLRGTFIVNGELTIAFKDSSATHLIYEHLKNRSYDFFARENDIQKLDDLPKERIISMLRSGFGGTSPVIGTVKDSNGNPRVVVSENTFEDVLGGSFEFDRLASQLEASIWGVSQTKRALTRIDQLDSRSFVDRNGIPYDSIGPGQNLLIAYGNVDNPSANQTFKTLSDVHFVDSSQSMDSATGFVIETYRFFAKGIDEPAGPLATFPIGGNVTADSSNIQKIVHTYRLDITTGIDPITPTFDGSVLSDMELFISNMLREVSISEEKSAQAVGREDHSKTTKESVVNVSIILPTEWTMSDGGYSSVTTLSPISRSATLDFLARVIIDDIIEPSFSRSIQINTSRSSSLLNEILIEISV